jgi:flagellar hook-associated protein 1
MTLSVSLDAARSSLAATAEQIAVASRNVSRAGLPEAIRKNAALITVNDGQVLVARVSRDDNPLLLDRFLFSNSGTHAGQALTSALDRLQATVDDVDYERSPAALIANMTGALQRYSASPYDISSASSVVSAAKDLTSSLNTSSAVVADVRRQADQEISTAVANVNQLLAKFGELNQTIVAGTRAGRDVTDALDMRDHVLKALSDEIGIRTIARADGDMALFTESGVTMFDKIARPVTFNPTPLLAAGQIGLPVYVDGVPVSGTPQIMAVRTGRIAGLVAVRDDVAPAYQTKLDEIARGLIEAFAEYDQSAVPSLPPAAGLFTYPGAPALPPTGTLVHGLSAKLSVNPNVDPAVGGQPFGIRDGGVSSPGNPAYTYNTQGGASFGERIQQQIAELGAGRSFDPVAGLETTASVGAFASSAASSLQAQRKTADANTKYLQVVSDRAAATLAKETGVNLDEEMANMLDLERSYQASARLLSAIDALVGTLLDAVR